MTKNAKKCSFVVQIMGMQNQTWQGTVTWLNGKHTEAFRSLLELIKLMDSAVNSEPEEAEIEAE